MLTYTKIFVQTFMDHEKRSVFTFLKTLFFEKNMPLKNLMSKENMCWS